MPSQHRALSLFAAAAVILSALTGCSDNGTGPADTLSSPSSVQATATSTTSIRVTWSQVAGAESYELDRAQGTGGSYTTIRTGLTSTFFEDTNLQSSTDYSYQVRAVKGSNRSTASVAVTAKTGVPGPKVAVLTGITSSRTLYTDTTYVLSGYVKVSNGATLTIQPGTTIVGDTLVPGSSLWILRGSRLVANGTATQPIVFTSQRAAGSRAPGDWGGIIIVGNAPINRTANPIFTEGPTGAAENYAGGTNFNDNSGSLKYVRIEFAGYDVSNGGGQELNSLSSYAVGRGTTYEYVQAMAGLDDSFEWFGGAVDGRYLVSFEAGDDHFDWTEGYQGRNQFMIALQTSVLTPRPGSGTVSSDPRGFEGDGCESDKAGCTYANTPHSMPVFANFTLVGPGAGVFSTTDGNGAVVRRGSAGTFVNGIIARWPGVGISVRDTETGALLNADSLYFRNVMLAENGSNFEAQANGRFGYLLNTNAAAWSIATGTLATVFPGALPTGTTTITTSNLNLRPAATSTAATAGRASFTGTPIAVRGASFFGGSLGGTTYVGALDPAASAWYEGWTKWERK